MIELHQRIRRNVYFILATAILALAVLFAVGTVFALTVTLAIDETSVGPIYLGNRSESDYPTYLERRVSEWRTDASYSISFQGYVYEIDLGNLHFDADATAAGIVRGSDNLAVFDIGDDARTALIADLEALFSDTVTSQCDLDAFLGDLIADVSHLYQIRMYRLGDYLALDASETILATVVLDGLDPDDVAAIAAAATFYEIPASSRFSLLEATAMAGLDNDQLSILASLMQVTTGATRFQSFVYRAWNDVPGWADVGRNIRIMRVSGLDFAFYNPIDFTYRFDVTAETATSLRIDLIGVPFVETIVSAWELAAVVPFATETIDDPDVDASTPGVIVLETDTDTVYRVLVRAGADGAIWFLNRSVTMPGGTPAVERIAIEERLSVAAIYRENVVPKGGE